MSKFRVFFHIIFIFLAYFRVCEGFVKDSGYLDVIAAVVEALDPNFQVLVVQCFNYGDLKHWRTQNFEKLSNPIQLIEPEQANILEFTNGKVRSYHFFLDLSCGGSESFLQKANDLNRFSLNFKWLIFESKPTGKIVEVLKPLSILTDTEVFISTKINRSLYHLKEVYKIKANDNAFIEDDSIGNVACVEVAGIVETCQLNWNLSHPVVANRRMNFHNRTLTATSLMHDNDTWNHLHDFVDHHIDPVLKVTYLLFELFEESINATLQYLWASDYGYPIPNSSYYSGMVGDIQRNRADLIVFAIFINRDRLPLLDYMGATMTRIRGAFVFRPPQLSEESNVFILPFSPSVWLCCGISVMIFYLWMMLILKWEQKNDVSAEETHDDDEGENALFMAVSAVCQQGTTVDPQSASGRFSMILLYGSLMFLFTAYSANIIVLLQTPADSIRTVADLLDSSLRCSSMPEYGMKLYFELMDDPLRVNFYKTKMMNSDSFLPLEEGIERMRTERFAYNFELSTGYKLVHETFKEHEKCGLVEIKYFYFSPPWTPIRRGSPLREILAIKLRILHERGLQSRITNRLTRKKPECSTAGTSFSSVGLNEIYFPFVMAIYGLIASGLVVTAEIFYYRIKSGKVPMKSVFATDSRERKIAWEPTKYEEWLGSK